MSGPVNTGNPVLNSQDAAIARIYSQLAGELQKGAGAQKDIFDTGSKYLGRAYDQGDSLLKSSNARSLAAMAKQFGTLGISEAGGRAALGASKDLAEYLRGNALNRTAGLSALGRQGTQYTSAAQFAVQGSQREGAQARVNAMNMLRKALFQEQGQEATARGQVALARQQGANQTAALKAQIAAAHQAAVDKANSTNDPLAQIKAETAATNLELLQQKLHGGGAQTGSKAGDLGSGQLGLNRYLNSGSDYWEAEAGPKFRAALQKIISTTESKAREPIHYENGEVVSYNPYNLAVSLIGGATKGTGLNADALRAALGLYFGKSR